MTFWKNDCMFQELETHWILGYGIRKGWLYYLEEHHQIHAHHVGVIQSNKSLAMLWYRQLWTFIL